jgi:hypothetical protein
MGNGALAARARRAQLSGHRTVSYEHPELDLEQSQRAFIE